MDQRFSIGEAWHESEKQSGVVGLITSRVTVSEMSVASGMWDEDMRRERRRSGYKEDTLAGNVEIKQSKSEEEEDRNRGWMR